MPFIRTARRPAAPTKPDVAPASRSGTVLPMLALPILLLPTLSAPAAAQGTGEQRAACTGDAMRLCLSAVPDVGRITACMKAHYGELSPRCQATFHESAPAAPPRKLAAEPAEPAEKPVARQVPATRPAEAKQAEVKQAVARPVEARPAGRAERADPSARRVVSRGRDGGQRVARLPVDRSVAERPSGIGREPAERAPRVASVERRVPPRHRREIDEAGSGDLADRDLAGREQAAREPAAREPVEPTYAPTPYAEAPAAGSQVERAPPYPDIAGGPIYAAPRPRLVTGLSASAGNLAAACREGLIDPFTCGHTIPTLGLGD